MCTIQHPDMNTRVKHTTHTHKLMCSNNLLGFIYLAGKCIFSFTQILVNGSDS